MAGTLAAAGGAPTELELDGVNGRYSNPGVTVEPESQGPVRLKLTSPSNSLWLDSNLVTLEPLGDGEHRARLEVTFHGEGWLVAELDTGAGASPFEDRVVVPSQSLEIAGRLRLTRRGDGYDIVPLEIPETVPVRFESGVAQSLLSICRGLAALPIMPIDCRMIERALTRADLPLPEAGEVFRLPDAQLTEDDRRRLDAYLASAEGGS